MKPDAKNRTPSKITFPVIALIVANLIPLAGVFFLGWDAALIVLLYWAENVVVGCYNILKMISLKIYARASILDLLFSIPFFCLHYGAFCAVHGLLLLSLFNMGEIASPFRAQDAWPGPLFIVQMLVSVMAGLWQKRPDAMEWSIACLFLSHGISFLQNFLGKKEYNVLNAQRLLIQPYKRIVVLHITVIAGAWPIMMLGSPVYLLCILILFKTGMDIFLHAREHRIELETMPVVDDIGRGKQVI